MLCALVNQIAIVITTVPVILFVLVMISVIVKPIVLARLNAVVSQIVPQFVLVTQTVDVIHFVIVK